ncbi:MAG: HepT-like ribonuclease domain-containing protein [Pseudomonadota bacterium]
MTGERDASRMEDMLDAVRQLLVYARGRSRHDLDTDPMLRDAILRQFEVLGEAARGVSERGRADLAEIPWRDIVSMRNQLIHAYGDVDRDIVWNTLSYEVPRLRDLLTSSLARGR